MNIPNTYIEWVDAFDYISNNPRNDSYIDMLNQGSLDYDELLIARLRNEMLKCAFGRLEREVNKFSHSLDQTTEYNDFSLKLGELKKEFQYAKRLITINIFPDNIKKEALDVLKSNADKVQRSMEEHTKLIDKTGAINSIVRNNPINKFD